ncbi:hypothetical protein PMI28_05861, partial [Pseudomonas sp. GM48]
MNTHSNYRNRIPCGSALARESDLPANISAACVAVFASKP